MILVKKGLGLIFKKEKSSQKNKNLGLKKLPQIGKIKKVTMIIKKRPREKPQDFDKIRLDQKPHQDQKCNGIIEKFDLVFEKVTS